MTTQSSTIQNPRVVSHEQWVTERVAFLAKEKEFTRLRDELSRQRRELPWEKVTKSYVFDGPSGKQTLAELFGDRSQLIVYHFMFDPAWDEGCKSCSFVADNFDGSDSCTSAARDTSFAVISRAPFDKIAALQAAHGVELPVAVLVRHRLQLRLRRDDRREPHGVQLRARRRPARRSSAQGREGRAERVPARRRSRVPHLLDLPARTRSRCSTPTTSSISRRSAATRTAGSCRGCGTTTSTRADRCPG